MASNFFSQDTKTKITQNVLTVTQLNEYAKRLLSGDDLLSFLSIEGEISGFKKYYGSGHCYFSLKDEKSSVSCVMFKVYADGLKFAPKDGMRVIVSGSATVYERDGKFQVYAQSMRTVGEGELYARFIEMKDKLEKDGLFDIAHKKALPLLPKCIGVVTSRSGAVFHDIINVTRRRFPTMNILLSPCAVQGREAPPQIVNALKKLDESGLCDVIIIGRGGGSMEDLWCFNDEQVARAVYACNTTVISAVGHETDFTITDFAADVRAPTPSAAAELAAPEYDKLSDMLISFKERMKRGAERAFSAAEYTLRIAERSLRTPEQGIGMIEMRLAAAEQKLRDTAEAKTAEYDNKLESLLDRLEALSPYAVLKRGYAFVRAQDDSFIKTAADMRREGEGRIVFDDGEVSVKVKDNRQ